MHRVVGAVMAAALLMAGCEPEQPAEAPEAAPERPAYEPEPTIGERLDRIIETGEEYSERQRTLVIESLRERLETLDHRVDELEREAAGAGPEARARIEERIDQVERAMDDAAAALEELRETGEREWAEALRQAREALDRMSRAHDDALAELEATED